MSESFTRQCCLRVSICIFNINFAILRDDPTSVRTKQSLVNLYNNLTTVSSSYSNLLFNYKIQPAIKIGTSFWEVDACIQIVCYSLTGKSDTCTCLNILAVFQTMTLPPVVTCSVGVQSCE